MVRRQLPLHRGAEHGAELARCLQPRIVARARDDDDLAVEACSKAMQRIRRTGIAGPADDDRAGRHALTELVHVRFERVGFLGGVELVIHHVVDGPLRAGRCQRPVPGALPVGVVGEPRQSEVLGLLGIGARLDRVELVEPGLLLIRAPCPLRCPVGVPPRVQEGPGEVDQPGHALGMREQEIAGHIGPERMPCQDNPVMSPRIEQQRQVADVPGDRVLPLPGRSAGAALVIPMNQAQVFDDTGDGGEIVRDPRTAMHHDHGKPLRIHRTRGPGAQLCSVIHLDHRRGHERETNAIGVVQTGARTRLPRKSGLSSVSQHLLHRNHHKKPGSCRRETQEQQQRTQENLGHQAPAVSRHRYTAAACAILHHKGAFDSGTGRTLDKPNPPRSKAPFSCNGTVDTHPRRKPQASRQRQRREELGGSWRPRIPGGTARPTPGTGERGNPLSGRYF
jgi:hypothetical protein